MFIVNKFVFTDQQIKEVEKYYNAKYMFDTCLRLKSGGWSNFPVAVFYTEIAHPEGSNYFGLYKSMDGHLRITDAMSAVSEPFEAIEADNGDIIYSSYRHDYRVSSDGSISVDGGRDYTMWGGKSAGNRNRIWTVKVEKDNLILEKNSETVLG